MGSMAADFARLVIEMREAQANAVRDRNPGAIDRARRLEAQVDREALAVISGRAERGLFDQEGE
jgi:hypothetical protein